MSLHIVRGGATRGYICIPGSGDASGLTGPGSSAEFQIERVIFFVKILAISGIPKISEGLSLHSSEASAGLVGVIGGSEITKGTSVAESAQMSWVGKGCNWAATLFLLASALSFGGVAGNWFSGEHAGGGLLFRFLQLATGSVAMGLLVAVPGSLLFGRNPIRWGMGMPILVYAGGVLVALVAGRAGVSGLILGAPLYLGFSIAAGMMGAFLVDGAFSRVRIA